MCGRYTQTAAFDELALRFGITVEDTGPEDLPPRYNVAPSQPVPIVVARHGARRLVMAKWGFRPAWMKAGKLDPINAKAETVAGSPMFQGAMKYGRCLVPADGFYEWKPVSGQRRKQPFYPPPDARNDIPATCTIITTTPNELVAPIHNRMPAILEPGDEAAWIDAGVTDPATALSCLRPLPAQLMEAYPVSTLVSAPGSEGAGLVEPVTG